MYDSESQDNKCSLNELLVKKKFAEFKLETDVCQQMNFRRDVNSYHQFAAKQVNKTGGEFPLVFDNDVLTPAEFQFDVSVNFSVSVVPLFIILLFTGQSADGH